MNRAQIENDLKVTLVQLQLRAGSSTETTLAIQDILHLNFRQAMALTNHDFSNILPKKLALWNKQLKHKLKLSESLVDTD